MSECNQATSSRAPAFAVNESIENFTVEFEVPGYDLGDLILDVDVTVGNAKVPGRTGPNRGLTPFEGSVPMPEPVVADQVVAAL
jgi:HSP20 family molecular chaperone IbpA